MVKIDINKYRRRVAFEALPFLEVPRHEDNSPSDGHQKTWEG
jgi:hypothetical protein